MRNLILQLFIMVNFIHINQSTALAAAAGGGGGDQPSNSDIEKASNVISHIQKEKILNIINSNIDWGDTVLSNIAKDTEEEKLDEQGQKIMELDTEKFRNYMYLYSPDRIPDHILPDLARFIVNNVQTRQDEWKKYREELYTKGTYDIISSAYSLYISVRRMAFHASHYHGQNHWPTAFTRENSQQEIEDTQEILDILKESISQNLSNFMDKIIVDYNKSYVNKTLNKRISKEEIALRQVKVEKKPTQISLSFDFYKLVLKDINLDDITIKLFEPVSDNLFIEVIFKDKFKLPFGIGLHPYDGDKTIVGKIVEKLGQELEKAKTGEIKQKKWDEAFKSGKLAALLGKPKKTGSKGKQKKGKSKKSGKLGQSKHSKGNDSVLGAKQGNLDSASKKDVVEKSGIPRVLDVPHSVLEASKSKMEEQKMISRLPAGKAGAAASGSSMASLKEQEDKTSKPSEAHEKTAAIKRSQAFIESLNEKKKVIKYRWNNLVTNLKAIGIEEHRGGFRLPFRKNLAKTNDPSLKTRIRIHKPHGSGGRKNLYQAMVDILLSTLKKHGIVILDEKSNRYSLSEAYLKRYVLDQ